MDPLFISLAWAVATGISTLAGKLVEKSVDAALEPANEQIGIRLQAVATRGEKDDALARAILTAVEDTSMQKGESLAVQRAHRSRWHTVNDSSRAPIGDKVTQLPNPAFSNESAFGR